MPVLLNAGAPWVRVGVFALCLVPLGLLVSRVIAGDLGPDPAQVLSHATGEWGLNFLLLALAATPAQRLGFPVLLRFRRMIGLFAFFYLCVHLLVFGQVYIGWSGDILREELLERPYVAVGFAAWLLLLPLALTSTSGWRRRLKQRWRQLHRLVYPAVILGWLHLMWLQRSDYSEALFYALPLVALLGWRVLRVRRRLLR
ncbi:membrane protein [Luminiphilus syltensis NOR5-1B]|uniref:Protein-methionine-sulfoxide reductase heme-binding subunit MsrQ n=1 Tax=Luminiphilus syltensis NOR5-1B TaxID=565045 RepID=B8KQI2_9GAMM|nr:protein-methionine-sulfoxide reductase heme-binding subunit MsrQ [Luminiphilus syltensis]EED36200.1 membrane protein [Luminiphilus syltensis NOR5-1B]